MSKKFIGWLLILAVAGCVTGITVKSAFIYVLSLMTLVATILLALLTLLINVSWKLLSENFKKIHKVTKRRFNAIIFFSAIFFYIIGGLMDELYLRDSSRFIRLLGIMTIFAFAVFIILILIRRSSGKIIAIGSVMFILFFISLLFISSLKSGETGLIAP